MFRRWAKAARRTQQDEADPANGCLGKGFGVTWRGVPLALCFVITNQEFAIELQNFHRARLIGPQILSMPAASQDSEVGAGDVAGLERRYRCAQAMMVDYAIGLAIVGMFSPYLTPVLMIAAALMLKMVWDIGQNWKFSFASNPIAIGGWFLSLLGACSMAILAWTTLTFIGALIPMVDHYAIAAALMSGAWALGAGANQFFLNGFLRRYDRQGSGQIHG